MTESSRATPLEAVPREVQRTGEAPPALEICVFVPVCEPPQALTELYWGYKAALESTGRSYEFLFVCEPWAHDALEPMARLRDAGEPIRILEVGQNVGETMLLRAGASHHTAPIVVTVPPYPRVAPEGIVELIRRLDAGVDLATARRETSVEPLINRLQRRAFHWILRKGVGGSFSDVASGVRAMKRVVLDEVPLHGDLFRFLPILADREGLVVEEVSVPPHPLSQQPRVHSPGVYVRRMLDLMGLLFLVRFTRKPLRFFGFVGGFFAGVGGVILLVLFVQRMGGRALADRPMLLLGVLLAVLGVQAVALGLLGEIIVHLDSAERPAYRLAGGRRPRPRGGADR